MHNVPPKKSKGLDVESINRKPSLLGFLRPSVAVAYEPRAADAAVGDAAWPDQHAVARSAAEITASSHRAVVLPLGAAELQTQPEAGRKVGSTQVADEGRLTGAAEQDLHAHVQAHLSVRRRRRARRVTQETGEAAPALAPGVGSTPFCRE